MKSARHSAKGKDAPSYSKDADAHFDTHQRSPNRLNNVRKWTNIRVETESTSDAMVEYSSSDFHKMTDLPTHFVRNLLEVPEDHPKAKDIRFLLDRAEKYVKCKDAQKEFATLLKDMSPEKQQLLQDVVARLMLQRMREEAARAGKEEVPVAVAVPMPAEEVLPAKRTVEEPAVEEQPAQKKAKGNDGVVVNLLLDRKTVSKATSTEEKLAIMVRLNEEKGNGRLEYNAKQFVWKYLKPTMYCLETHCGGEVEVFARKYPKYSHTTFEKCCDGTGSVCTPKENK